MEIEFEKEYLSKLYTEGKSGDKKHRFQPQIISKYKQTIDRLRAANKIEDLFPIKSLNYEKLSGDKNGIESVNLSSILNSPQNLF
jgi:proteic killer suppression protein